MVPGSHGRLFPGYREGHWWQYVIAAFILILGMCFVYAGKVESIEFDKPNKKMQLVKTNVFCCKFRRSYDLGDLNNVRLIKKGHDGINYYTIHYSINVEMLN